MSPRLHREVGCGTADRCVGRGHRQYHVADAFGCEDLRKLCDRTEHRAPQKLAPPFPGVVIDEPDNVPIRAAFELAHQHGTATTSADEPLRVASGLREQVLQFWPMPVAQPGGISTGNVRVTSMSSQAT